MAKESADSKSVRLAFARPVLQPPKGMAAEQSKVWAAAVASKPSDWFDGGSAPLLAELCRLVVEADRVDGALSAFDTEWLATDEGLKRYERLVNLQDKLAGRICSLAVKLRLSPSSHTRQDGAITKAKRKMPWEGRVIEHDEG